MTQFQLWICFYHAEESGIRWTPCLHSTNEVTCEVWLVSGQQYEFKRHYSRGPRLEDVLNLQEKWLIKDDLDTGEAATVREVAGVQPVDNDADFWDCRIFCFEILAELERRQVLSSDDHDYANVRRRLHNRWRSEDGALEQMSDESECELKHSNETSDSTEDLGDGFSTMSGRAISEELHDPSDVGGRKRTSSHGSKKHGPTKRTNGLLPHAVEPKAANRPEDD